MTTTTSNIEILDLPIGAKVKIEDYPYGFKLRTTLYRWIEYKKGKGYRAGSQTIDPRNGRPNKPKYSTYNHYMWLEKDLETGHIHSNSFDIYHEDCILNFKH